MTRIALAQMNCEKAAVAQNLQQIADLLAEAAARGVDILALPEMCLTGYADPTRYPQAVLRLDGPELAAPGLYGDQATRDHGLWIAVATQAGRTIDEDFPGGGYLFAPDGTRVYATEHWSPGVVYLDLDLAQGQAAPL